MRLDSIDPFLVLQPLVAFRALLTATVTSTRTHFSDFKKAHGKDARFREFGKTEGEKEREFKKYLRDLGEKKREAAEKADKEFKEMLSEDSAFRPGDSWTDVSWLVSTCLRWHSLTIRTFSGQETACFRSSLCRCQFLITSRAALHQASRIFGLIVSLSTDSVDFFILSDKSETCDHDERRQGCSCRGVTSRTGRTGQVGEEQVRAFCESSEGPPRKGGS